MLDFFVAVTGLEPTTTLATIGTFLRRMPFGIISGLLSALYQLSYTAHIFIRYHDGSLSIMIPCQSHCGGRCGTFHLSNYSRSHTSPQSSLVYQYVKYRLPCALFGHHPNSFTPNGDSASQGCKY